MSTLANLYGNNATAGMGMLGPMSSTLSAARQVLTAPSPAGGGIASQMVDLAKPPSAPTGGIASQMIGEAKDAYTAAQDRGIYGLTPQQQAVAAAIQQRLAQQAAAQTAAQQQAQASVANNNVFAGRQVAAPASSTAPPALPQLQTTQGLRPMGGV